MKSFVSISALGLVGAALFTGCGDDGESSSGGTGGSGSGGEGTGGAGTDPLVHLAQAELERNTHFLASDEMNGRDEGTAENAAARAHIIAELQKCGVEPAGIAGESGFEQPIDPNAQGVRSNGPGTNILGKVTGTDPNLASRHILVSAHYDHIGVQGGEITNGANDNAAGVAIAIGVVCAVAQDPLPRTVVFAGWDAEEPPTFQTDAMGSEYYGANPVIPLEQTDAVIVMDLVGSGMWAGDQTHVWLGAEKSPELAAAIDAAPIPEGLYAQRLGLHVGEISPAGTTPWSDHDAFRNRNVPFALISNGFDKSYHHTVAGAGIMTVADTADRLDYPKMAKQAQYLYDVVKNLGQAATNPTFVDAEDYLLDATSVVLFVERALQPGGLIDYYGLSAESRGNLEDDLANARAVQAKLSEGGQVTQADIETIRTGGQRILCHTGTYYEESTCNLLHLLW